MTAPGKPFKPGQSGNPGGRPKIIGHIRDLARQYTELAINTLADTLTDKKAPYAAKIAAAQALLDRGWGKATAYVANEANPFDRLSDAEKQSLLDVLDALAERERLGEGGASAAIN